MIISQPPSSPPSTTLPVSHVFSHTFDLPSPDTIQPSSSDLFLSHSRTPTNLNNHSMITRSKAGIFKSKTFLSNTNLQSSIPDIVTKALHSPQWFQAMTDEYDALINNNTWILNSLPMTAKLLVAGGS